MIPLPEDAQMLSPGNSFAVGKHILGIANKIKLHTTS